MEIVQLLFIVVSLMEIADFASAETPYHELESKLHRDLLDEYIPEARPITKNNEAAIVKMYLELLRIEGIDETKDTLITSISIAKIWTDPRLRWNKKDNGNITKIHVASDKLWKPDIVLYNKAPETNGNQDKYPSMIVSHKGEVTIVETLTLNAYCQLNLRNFPFDVQECNLVFGSWVFSVQELRMIHMAGENKTTFDVEFFAGHEGSDLQFRSNPSWVLLDNKVTDCDVVDLVPYKAIPEISLLERKRFHIYVNDENVISHGCAKGAFHERKYECCEEKYQVLEITMKLKRARQFYQYVLVGPGVILALLVPLQFLLPPNTAQRSLFGVMLILTTTILVTSMGQYFPFEHSSVPRIGVFFIITMSFAALAVFLSTIIASIASKGKHRRAMPAWLSQVCLGSKGLRRFLCVASTSPVNRMYSSVNSRLLEDMHEPAIEMLPEPDMDQEAGGKEMYNNTTEAYLRSIAKSSKVIAGRSVVEESLDKLNEEWQDVGKVLDRICFICFLVIYLISVISLVSHADDVS